MNLRTKNNTETTVNTTPSIASSIIQAGKNIAYFTVPVDHINDLSENSYVFQRVLPREEIAAKLENIEEPTADDRLDIFDAVITKLTFKSSKNVTHGGEQGGALFDTSTVGCHGYRIDQNGERVGDEQLLATGALRKTQASANQTSDNFRFRLTLVNATNDAARSGFRTRQADTSRMQNKPTRSLHEIDISTVPGLEAFVGNVASLCYALSTDGEAKDWAENSLLENGADLKTIEQMRAFGSHVSESRTLSTKRQEATAEESAETDDEKEAGDSTGTNETSAETAEEFEA